MGHVLILIADPAKPILSATVADLARHALAEAGTRPGSPRWLAESEACEIAFDATVHHYDRYLDYALAGYELDRVVLPAARRRKKLLAADMDSTMVTSETLDELAAQAGLGSEIAEITRRSIAGEIDFTEALRERVAMLKGLEASAVARVLQAVEPTPGAATLVRTMKAHGAYTVLISGGFSCFTRHVASMLGFDGEVANDLGISRGRLTGKVDGPVMTREGKATALRRLVSEQAISLQETIAVGDGANDLEMMRVAGLAVGFRPQPVLRHALHAVIRHGDLTSLLYLQGYTKADFAV